MIENNKKVVKSPQYQSNGSFYHNSTTAAENESERRLTGKEAFDTFIENIVLKALDPLQNHLWLIGEGPTFYRGSVKSNPWGHLTRLKKNDKPESRETVGKGLDLYPLLRELSEKEGNGVTWLPTGPQWFPLKARFTGSKLLYLEFDGISIEQQWELIDLLRAKGLNPSAIVGSGGKSLHIYFLLDQLVDEQALLYLNGLFIPLGCDPKPASNVVNQMRVPGFYRHSKGNEQTLEFLSESVYSVASVIEAVKLIYAEKNIPFKSLEDRAEKQRQAQDRYEHYEAADLGKFEGDDLKKLVEEILNELPPRVPGTGTYEDYRRLTTAIARFVGVENAINVMSIHSPEMNWGILRTSTGRFGFKSIIESMRVLVNPDWSLPQWFQDKYFRQSKSNPFRKWLEKQLQRITKPKKSGIKPEGQEFEGHRAKKWIEITNKGKAVLDASFMGSGKSHDVTSLESEDGTIWYAFNDHRNPTVKGIENNFADLMPRLKHGLTRDEDGRLIKADLDTPQEKIVYRPNCDHADLFNHLQQQGYNPNINRQTEDGKKILNPICGTCPMAHGCGHTPGYYRHARRQTLAASKIRAHLDSLPDPDEWDYSHDTLIVDEVRQQLKPVRTITSDWKKILIEADRYRQNLNNDQWLILDGILQKIKPLFNNEERWGLKHAPILETVGNDADLSELIAQLENNPLPLDGVFVEADGADLGKGDKRQWKGAARTADAYFRNEANKQSRENLKEIPPNALIYVLKAISGQKGIALRITYGLLSIAIDNRAKYSKILNAVGRLIFLDASIDPEHLREITGLERTIEVIRSKADLPLKNLTVVQILTKGISSKQVSDTALGRIKAIKETLPKMPVIGPKHLEGELGLDGYWFRDNRASNEFEGQENLMFVGLPNAHVGSLEDEYFALHGEVDEQQFGNYYNRLVDEEILQGNGRPRANRYPNQNFTIYHLTPEDTDLSWLAEYGAKIIVKSAFEVSPEAGSENQYALQKLLEGAQQCLTDGIKVTQAAIANVLGCGQSAISKTLSKHGITLKWLVERLSKIIPDPYKDSIRTRNIFTSIYEDIGWIMNADPCEVIQDVLEIVKLGKVSLDEYLDHFPKATQTKILGVFLAVLSGGDCEKILST